MEENRPLLTIAIPTWNRAAILEKALERILPQVNDFKEMIELVISDNASTDPTREIIQKFKTAYPGVRLISFLQSSNTGMFGNFRKCRELSGGKYFWLLSDNDYVFPGVISAVVKGLQQYPEISLFFLKDWVNAQPEGDIFYNITQNGDFNAFIKKATYYPTLISSGIIRNSKGRDAEIFEKYQGNLFVGFMFLLESVRSGFPIITMNGASLYLEKAEPSFDVFKAWIEDMSECIRYAQETGVLKKSSGLFYKNIVAREILYRYYMVYKQKGSIFRTTGIGLTDLFNRLYRHYRSCANFWKFIFPVAVAPVPVLKFYSGLRKPKTARIDS
ncbi:MAG TPA: glycosyltransferase family 2 protein [Bacteroidales bacterium]|nr:glycosyltransferase family 2 protein [Bacteroidales bacterium]